MRLRDDWKQITTKAWSVRFLAVAAIFTGAEAALPIIGYKLPLPDWGLGLVTLGVVGAAYVSRLVAQEGLK